MFQNFKHTIGPLQDVRTVKTLNETEMSLLRLLATMGPMSREELASALKASANTIYHALARLVAWGYITTEKLDVKGPGKPRFVYLPTMPISEIARSYVEKLGAGDLLLAADLLGGKSIVDVRGLPLDYGKRILLERLNYHGTFFVIGKTRDELVPLTQSCEAKGVRVQAPRQAGNNLWVLLVG